jgi:hypothetical protein
MFNIVPIHAIIMDNVELSCDFIIGMDLMQTLGIDIHNLSRTIVWGDLQVPVKPHDCFSSNLCQTVLQDQMVGSFDKHDADEELLGYKSKAIKSSLYEQHDPHHVAEQQTHLSTSQRQELTQLLVHFPKLLCSKLGCFPNKQVHLELQKTLNRSSVICTQYPNIMSKSSKTSFNISVTLECLKDVVHPNGYRLHLLLQKKNGRVRWISDFWQLNKFIKHKVYNLPKIQDIL